jgi:molybdopterin converting factor small subunit
MPHVKASLLFPANQCKERLEMEAVTIQDVIETFVKLCGQLREYFYLDDGNLNGATFVTINGKLLAIHEAARIPLTDGDVIFFGQVADGG